MPVVPVTVVPFPRGGVVRSLAFGEHPPRTAFAASNIWPAQPSTGRLRGGTRPDLVAMGATGGTPMHWTDLQYKSTGGTHAAYIHRVTAVVSDGYGTKISADGDAWDAAIAHDPNSDFCSVAAFKQILFQASQGHEDIYYKDYSDASSGTLASNPSPPDSTAVPPTYAGCICNWGGALLVGGIKGEPHALRRSALGDPFNWDESDTDPDAAFVTTGAGDAKIGEAIVVVFAHNRDCAIVGSPSSCYVLRGNPSVNGSIEKLSNHIGPLCMAAICKGWQDDTYMLTRSGPAVIASGCGKPPVMIGGAIPNDLIGVDPGDGDWASVAYDDRWRMVHFLVNKSGGATAYWGYQVEDKSWWPMTAESTLRLAIEIPRISSDDVASALAVDSDGTVRRFDRSIDVEEIGSYIDLGPFIHSGNPATVGLLHDLNVVLAEDSDPVQVDVYLGASEQEAMNSSDIVATYTFSTPGHNIRRLPRRRGFASKIRLSNPENGRISVEQVLLGMIPVGGRRTM